MAEFNNTQEHHVDPVVVAQAVFAFGVEICREKGLPFSVVIMGMALAMVDYLSRSSQPEQQFAETLGWMRTMFDAALQQARAQGGDDGATLHDA